MLHDIFPETGWVSYEIAGDAAIPGAIVLFRLSYERAAAAQCPGGRQEATLE